MSSGLTVLWIVVIVAGWMACGVIACLLLRLNKADNDRATRAFALNMGPVGIVMMAWLVAVDRMIAGWEWFNRNQPDMKGGE